VEADRLHLGRSGVDTVHFTLPPLSDFVSSENMEVKIESWFIESFKKIKSLSEQHPELNWHIPL